MDAFENEQIARDAIGELMTESDVPSEMIGGLRKALVIALQGNKSGGINQLHAATGEELVTNDSYGAVVEMIQNLNRNDIEELAKEECLHLLEMIAVLWGNINKPKGKVLGFHLPNMHGELLYFMHKSEDMERAPTLFKHILLEIVERLQAIWNVLNTKYDDKKKKQEEFLSLRYALGNYLSKQHSKLDCVRALEGKEIDHDVEMALFEAFNRPSAQEGQICVIDPETVFVAFNEVDVPRDPINDLPGFGHSIYAFAKRKDGKILRGNKTWWRSIATDMVSNYRGDGSPPDEHTKLKSTKGKLVMDNDANPMRLDVELINERGSVFDTKPIELKEKNGK